MHWMKSFKTPTPEAIERVVARLGKPGASAYFFDKLENPAWVTPLYGRGFFKRPPLADRSRNDGSVAFPDWPELRYLKRMAPLAPGVIGPIVADIPDTDNLRVRQLQIEIACELGREVSQKLADRAVEWLDDPLTVWHFAEPFPNFIVHLLGLGEPKRALRLARKLFNSRKGDGSRRPVQLDEWHYQRYLNVCLPALRQYAGLATLVLLRDLLLDSTREPREGRTDDYSYIWRCDLLHANYTHKQLGDILIDAVRDTALELSRRSDVGFKAVRVALLASPRGILTRIVLFIAREVCEPTDPFVLATLLDTKLVDRYTHRI